MRAEGRGAYQAWAPPQCGQPTDVETWASNTNPQSHVYIAWSWGTVAWWRRRTTIAAVAAGASEASVVGPAGPAPGAGRGGSTARPGRSSRWRPRGEAPDLLRASTVI